MRVNCDGLQMNTTTRDESLHATSNSFHGFAAQTIEVMNETRLLNPSVPHRVQRLYEHNFEVYLESFRINLSNNKT